MNRSAPSMTSARLPFRMARLVTFAMAVLAPFRPSRPSQMAPCRSQRVISRTPAFISSLQMEMPAAPAPLMTVCTCGSSSPRHLAPLMRAASTTTAVPC